MNQDLKNKLVELGGKAQQLTNYTLDYGGCCVYAAMVGRKLKDKGYYVRGVVSGEKGSFFASGKNLHKVRPKILDKTSLHEWDSNGNIDIHHVGLKVGRGEDALLFDSEGYFPPGNATLGGYELIDGTMSVEELEALASNADNWNRRFDRRHIPKLQKLIDQSLEDL